MHQTSVHKPVVEGAGEMDQPDITHKTAVSSCSQQDLSFIRLFPLGADKRDTLGSFSSQPKAKMPIVTNQ
jgi:hypothetical protein